MVVPAPGAVVVVPFPFSDVSRAKLRPAVILADAGRGRCVLPVTRPGKLFTASRDLMSAQAGSLQAHALLKIIEAVLSILRTGPRE